MPISIASLSQDAIQRLTYTLRLLPDVDALEYSNWVLASIKALPAPLRRPSRLSVLFSKPLSSHRTPLCQLHSLLNFHLVDSLCKLLALECSVRLENLVTNVALLPQNQQDRVRRIRRYHQLYMHADPGSELLRPEASSRFLHETSCCPPCCIARLATHPDFLIDLLIVTGSRHDKRPATIIRYLHSFLSSYTKHLESQAFMRLFAALDEETTALRACRKVLHRIRVQSGVREDEPLPQSSIHTEMPGAGPGAAPYDSVLSIVDLYASLRPPPSRLPTSSLYDTRPASAHSSTRQEPLILANSGPPHVNLDDRNNEPKPASSDESVDSSEIKAKPSSPSSSTSSNSVTPRAYCATLANRRVAYLALVGAEEESAEGVATGAIARPPRANGQNVQGGESGGEAACQSQSAPTLPTAAPPTDIRGNNTHHLLRQQRCPAPPPSLFPHSSRSLARSQQRRHPHSNTSSVYSQAGLSTYAVDVPLYLDNREPPPLPHGIP